MLYSPSTVAFVLLILLSSSLIFLTIRFSFLSRVNVKISQIYSFIFSSSCPIIVLVIKFSFNLSTILKVFEFFVFLLL